MISMRVRRAGTRALLIECDDGEQAEAWRAELWRRRDELGFVDLVPGARTVLIDGVDPAVESRFTSLDPTKGANAVEDRLIDIPTTFDGDDLADVADWWGLTPSSAIDRLAGAELTVAFCGFAPGFAYLRGLPDEWSVPRLAAPRPRVPAGSVALAGAYAGIYPSASPGGWRLVGRTDVTLFDVRAEPPALLTPGTRVRLVPVP
jgi:KipI family sensor histidine kinase inhibitor